MATSVDRHPGTGLRPLLAGAPADDRGLSPLAAAVRARWGLVALLLAIAGAGWWWTVHEMRGMDNGPWTGLGAFGWFVGVWVVMMAAMMLPSVAPTIALYSRMTRRRSPAPALLFGAGYLIVWASAGLVAFGIAVVGRSTGGGILAWDSGGRWVAGGILLLAAVYELTPLKDVCLGKCRSPLGTLLGSWRSGLSGSLRMGADHAAWCLGCCWALMAALFALGVMSLVWMAVIAALIAIEKTLPWRRVATYGVAGLLVLLGLLILIDPSAVPALTIPQAGSMAQMHSPMTQMK